VASTATLLAVFSGLGNFCLAVAVAMAAGVVASWVIEDGLRRRRETDDGTPGSDDPPVTDSD